MGDHILLSSSASLLGYTNAKELQTCPGEGISLSPWLSNPQRCPRDRFKLKGLMAARWPWDVPSNGGQGEEAGSGWAWLCPPTCLCLRLHLEVIYLSLWSNCLILHAEQDAFVHAVSWERALDCATPETCLCLGESRLTQARAGLGTCEGPRI